MPSQDRDHLFDCQAKEMRQKTIYRLSSTDLMMLALTKREATLHIKYY